MNKSKLERFIQKYSLGGAVDSVKWVVKNNTLMTSFIDTGRTLLGTVVVDKFNFQDAVLGVYSTSQLMRLLNVVGDNVELDLVSVNGQAVSLRINDVTASANFMLADLSVIQDPPSMKNLPVFDTEIKIDSKFIETFIKGKNALADVDTFTVLKNGEVKIVIGHSNTNSNKVTIPVESNDPLMLDEQSFDANIFKEILSANKECLQATLRISDKGLAHVKFHVDDYQTEYYLTGLQSTV
jgi:hypothetical protein